MKFITVTVFLACVAASSALFFGGKDTFKWNTLRVTWGLVPIKGKFFDTMPTDVQEAESQGWRNVSTSCSNDGTFSGYRFVLEQDTSMSLIFNVHGVISGIQMNPKAADLANNGNTYKFDEVPMFQQNNIESDVVNTLTAYFSEPSSICDPKTARTAEALGKNGVGERLFFQEGKASSSNYEAPQSRQVALTSGWNKNNCFPGMGWHTWYKSEELQANNCDKDRPVFLLFDKEQRLIGFGFNVVGTAKSVRYENPPLMAVKTIMGNPPPCLVDAQKNFGLTTMHVFFVDYSELPKVDCLKTPTN